jgi:voltage-gated potassium channel
MAVSPAAVRLPRPRVAPVAKLGLRVLAAVALTAFVTFVAYLDRDGYRDANGSAVSLLDCFYYATVSITTTGYGDIIPVTDTSRLLTTVLVTPARVLFLILLVGTTLEVLAESSRTAFRERRWRHKLRDHTIVCGYGTKGRSALETLRAKDVDPVDVVVVDPSAASIEEAVEAGCAGIVGDARRLVVLERAGGREAAAVIVATDRDDASVLITLTAREQNKRATIVAAAREDENRHLLHESGADSVITSSGAAGRLLGLATLEPKVVEVLEDLFTIGAGLDLVERPVTPELVGRPIEEAHVSAPVLGVVRGDEVLRFDDERVARLEAGDRLVCLCSN